MSHSYCSSLFHCVFSAKDRRKLIDVELQSRLWPYIGGIARDHGMKALAVGGVEDHVHLLLSIPSAISVSKAMQLVKGGSSKWVHETFSDRRAFAWQEGYGAFSIGVSQIEDTKRYIENQAEHHRQCTFEEELVAFLERHDVAYDPRTLRLWLMLSSRRDDATIAQRFNAGYGGEK